MFSGRVSQLFFSCTGYLRILLRRGIGSLPGAALLFQQGLHLRHTGRRSPPLEEGNGPVRQKTLGRGLLRCLCRQTVRVHPQGIPRLAVCGDGRRSILLPFAVLRQSLTDGREIRVRRAGEALERNSAEAEGPQALHHGLLVLTMAYQQAVFLLLVTADLQQFRRQIAKRHLDLTHVDTRRHHTGTEQHVLRTRQLQGHIHGLPRQKRRLSCRQTVLLTLETGKGLQLFADFPADCFGPLCRPGAEELLFRDGMALDEQSVFQSSVVPDGLQSNVHAVDLGFGVRQTGEAALQQCGSQAGSFNRPSGSLISTQPRRNSARSSASRRSAMGHDAELFHFYNGHISPPLSFRQ